MAMASTNGGKKTTKKLTPEQKRFAEAIQRIGAIDKKPTKKK